jgi:hypothetical protein
MRNLLYYFMFDLFLYKQIDEIRMFMVSNMEDYERNAIKYQERSWDAKGRSGLLRGTGPKVDQEELIAQLPPKAVVDILVDRYFLVYSWIMRIYSYLSQLELY